MSYKREKNKRRLILNQIYFCTVKYLFINLICNEIEKELKDEFRIFTFKTKLI